MITFFLLALSYINNPVWNYSINSPIKDAPLVSNDGLNMYISTTNKSSYDLYHFRNHDGNSTKVKCEWEHYIKGTLLGDIFSPPVLDNSETMLYLITSNNYLIVYNLDKETIPCNSLETYLVKKLKYINGNVYTRPIINKNNNILYFGTSYPDNSLYSINVDGSLIWKFHTGDSILASPVLNEAQNVIYFTSKDNNIYAVNTISGIPIWIYSTNDYIVNSPVINNNTIIVTSKDNNVYFIANDTGKIKNITRIGNSNKPAVYNDSYIFTTINGKIISIGKNNWTYTINDEIMTAPIMGDNGEIVYIASNNGMIYGLDVLTGNKLWYSNVNSKIYSDPVLSPRCDSYRCIQSLYITTLDGGIYAFNTTFDKSNWRIKYDGIYKEHSITNNIIISIDNDIGTTLYLIDTNTNNVLWSNYFYMYNNVYEIVIKNNIYLFGWGDLYVINKYTGAIIADNQINSAISYNNYKFINSSFIYLVNQYETYNTTLYDLNIINNQTTSIDLGKNKFNIFGGGEIVNKYNSNSSIMYQQYQWINYNEMFLSNQLLLFNLNTNKSKTIEIPYKSNNSKTYETPDITNILQATNDYILSSFIVELSDSMGFYSNKVDLVNMTLSNNNITILRSYLFNWDNKFKIQNNTNYMVLLNVSIPQKLIIVDLNTNIEIIKNVTNGNDIGMDKYIFLETYNDQIKTINLYNYGGSYMYNFSFPTKYVDITYIFNKDYSIVYVCNYDYLYAVNKNNILWDYPINCNNIILSSDEMTIYVYNDNEIVSLTIPFM
jgi:outer membrane protein assembly factor BamB